MKILVATGGAAHSTVALTFGAHLAQLCNAELVVLTVVKQEAERARAEGVLQSAHFVLEPLLPAERLSTLIRVGHPAEEILAAAEEAAFELVVVGEKQHHGLMTRFVLGSTAQRVIEHAPCPVVLVKGQIGPVRRVVICDSGRVEKPIVERMAEQLPQMLHGASTITVLHVMSHPGTGPGGEGRAMRASAVELIHQDSPAGKVLYRDLQILSGEGHACTPRVRHGLVVDEVLAEAHDRHYDLVVIGAHEGGGWRRILLDDIAHQIVSGLDRPVLVVR